MTLNYPKYRISILKLYIDICLMFTGIITISIIFTHCFHSLLSTGNYLRSIFMIWLIFIPLFPLIYYSIPIIKKTNTLSSKILTNKKHPILKFVFISLTSISLVVYYQSNYVRVYFASVMSSAKPNLFEGDYLMVDRFWTKHNSPSRGEVIGIKTSKLNFDLIKRCVALGGDTLEIKNGIVLINNEPEGKFLYLKNTKENTMVENRKSNLSFIK